jgi:3-hydroxybutyryl-CoA dehydrogenase
MKDIKTLTLIGAGFIGEQIALRSLLYDYHVKIHDIDEDRLSKVEKSIKRSLRAKGKKDVLERVTFYIDLKEACKDTDLIIEATPEKIDLKKDIFTKLDQYAPAHAIIATNSSSIPVSALEDSVKRKDRVLNIHFYAPIQRTTMADIMRGTHTSDEVFEKGINWIRTIECTPLIVKKECFGFVFNRIWHAIKKESLNIWAGGHADIEVVDDAWKIFTGMGLGPFKMMDQVGLDVVYDIEMSYYENSKNSEDQPPAKLKEMIDRGELGVKSGKGFYVYKQ